MGRDGGRYAKGEKASFLIQIDFRRNATWQGTITWIDGHKKQQFRSALELIRLIDSVSDEIAAEKYAFLGQRGSLKHPTEGAEEEVQQETVN